MAAIIKREIGLEPKNLFLTGAALFAFYLKGFSLKYPPEIKISGISLENLDKFLNHFSSSLENLKGALSREQQVNEKFAYSYNSLKAYPIIRLSIKEEDLLLCPLPTLLFWRLTNGVYYEICNSSGFDNAFGFSFQKYVGEVIKTGFKRAGIYPEEEYFVGKKRKDSVDWIAEMGDECLFIECKTKRMTILAKTEIASDAELEAELDFMSNFIMQIYKGIQDWTENRYPSYTYGKDKGIFPMVVTLEDWFMFGNEVLGRIEEKVKKKLIESKLPLEWLEQMPYSICSIQEFEEIVQVMQVTGIGNFMSKKVHDRKKKEWGFNLFINREFRELKGHIKILFPHDYESIFPKGIIEKFVKKENV